MQFEPGLKIPDTYGNVPGTGTGGRSVIAAPYDARKLGDLVHASTVCDEPDEKPNIEALNCRRSWLAPVARKPTSVSCPKPGPLTKVSLCKLVAV